MKRVYLNGHYRQSNTKAWWIFIHKNIKRGQQRCTKLSFQRLSAPYWPKNPGHPGRLEMDNHMALFSSLPLLWDWFLPVEETIKNVRIKTITKIK